MFKQYKNKVFCFSPPVMLATFLIEFSLAAYTLWRYKMTTLTKLVFVTLVALGTFQLAEYMLCGGLGLTNIQWARVGYGAITLLPALGIHILVTIAGKKAPYILTAAYGSMAVFLGFYLMAESAVTLNQCAANYAVFKSYKDMSLPFGFYYYGWLLIGTFLAWRWGEKQPKQRKALNAMAIGYMAFILPTTTVNIIDSTTISAIPSIMCGFAVIFAIVLVAKVLPSTSKDRIHAENAHKKIQA
jgi:hypothetical protein